MGLKTQEEEEEGEEEGARIPLIRSRVASPRMGVVDQVQGQKDGRTQGQQGVIMVELD